MATDALMIVSALIGIGVIVIGIMLLMNAGQQQQRPTERIVIREQEPFYRRWWRRDAYSHVPVRPVLYG
jgi:hypothetical protein